MRELGSMSNIEEISVIKYTINGINDIETNKIILYGATNVAEFKLKLDLYAEFKSKISNTVKSFKPFDKRTEFCCFNCGKVGHESRECHKKLDGPKCFNCMKHGHIVPNCPHPRKPRSSADTKGIDTKETKIILSANVKFNHKLVKINNYEIDALIDTGSDLTLLREDVYNNMKLPVLTNKTSNLFGIDETQIKTLGCFQTLVEFDTICVETTVHVVSRLSLNLECIIGNDVLRGTKIIMNENNVTIEKICDENLLACYSIQEEQEEINFPEVEDISYTNKIKDLITTYSPNRIKESPIKMKILLKSEYPIWQPPKRLSPGEKDEVTSKDEHEAVIKIKEVLKVATEYGLKFKWKKCKFLRRHIEFLGYEISEGAVKPSREKIKAVKNFTEPKSLKLVQSFLGLSGYFRKFIKDYASIARPLSDLLRKSAKFEFGPAQRNAFNLLKDSLTSNNILKIYSPLLETELHTDASKFGFGGILLQRCKEDYQFHPIYYYSKKTTPVQEKYCSYELEVLAIVNALKKFRVYLLGIKFNIVTDCAAFKMTMQKKDIAPRIAGWAFTLEDYNYTLEHRPSSKMRHVDALSRNPLVMVITDEFMQRIQLCQDKDENLCLTKQLLQHGPYKEYVLNRDVIFKKDEEGRDLLCVPKLMQQELIKTIHGQGHFGVKKMVELIQREYYISKLREKCETCRRNCILRILAERKAGKQEGFLHTIDKDKYPLLTYHIDHLGPMHNTAKNYKYIFSVVDAFTKFVWLYPVKTITTTEVIQKLEIQKTNFGNPSRIITDKGTAFTSNEFENYCRENKVELVSITTGVPRGNGQIERINRIIIPALTKLSIDDPEHWYRYTDQLQRYINSTWQRSISTTPFEVMFGVKMKNPEDLQIATAVEEAITINFNKEREESRQEARLNIQKIQEENRRNYNTKRKTATIYKIDDIVAVKRTQFGSGLKILPKFLGPYKITKVGSNERYEIEKVGNHSGPYKTSASADNLKQWNNYYQYDSEDSDGSLEESNNNEDNQAEFNKK